MKMAFSNQLKSYVFSMLVVASLTTSCGLIHEVSSQQQLDSTTPNSGSTSQLLITGFSNIQTNECSGYDLSLLDSNMAPLTLSTQVSVDLTATNVGSFYSDFSCTSTVSSVLLEPGAGNKTIFYKATSASNSLLSGVVSNGATGSLEININGVSHTMLGQPSGTTIDNYRLGMEAPQFVQIIGSRLFVTDTANHRVLLWNSIPTVDQTAPDLAYGQVNISQGNSNFGGINARSLASPRQSFFDGTKYFIADTANNRVLIWNTFPASTQTPANVVIGQSDFSSSTANSGGVSASSLSSPSSVFSDGTKLFIVDSGNHRVLIYNSIPTSNFAEADVVLGQADFTSNTANSPSRSGSTFNGPREAIVVGTKLIVSDKANHRVLIWNTLPSSNGAAADVVIGQSSLTAGSADSGGLDQGLDDPYGIASDGTNLYIADSDNNRVVVFNSIPVAHHAAFSFVLGQPSNASSGANNPSLSATSMSGPLGVSVSGTKLVVSDSDNNRVLIWNSLPSTDGEAANVVLGQNNMNINVANNPGGISATTLNLSRGVYKTGSKLISADYNNHRILIWNSMPTSSNAAADVVLGQPNFTSYSVNAGGSTSASGLNKPMAVYSDGTLLYVADYDNDRILGWNSIPTVSNTPADFAIGQANLTSGSHNSPSRSSSTMYRPYHVTGDGTRLLVTDAANNRVLIYNSLPTSNVAADVILGQTDGTTASSGSAADQLDNPSAAFNTGTKVIVVDKGNHRVLIWNSIPTVNKQAADVVLGQADFNQSSSNAGGTVTAKTLATPTSAFVYNGKLYVSDHSNNRVLIWNSIPTSNYTAADQVIGQVDFVTRVSNYPSLSSSTLYYPFHLFVDATYTIIPDHGNSRILIYE